eukprot:gene49172-60190_t
MDFLMPKKRLKAITGLAAPVAVINDQRTTGGGAQTLGDGFNQRWKPGCYFTHGTDAVMRLRTSRWFWHQWAEAKSKPLRHIEANQLLMPALLTPHKLADRQTVEKFIGDDKTI